MLKSDSTPPSVKEDWSATKERLKQKFNLLTNKDLLLIEGRHDEMLIKLQIKLGKTREEIIKLISEL